MRKVLALLVVLLTICTIGVVVASPAAAVTYVGKVCFYNGQDMTGNYACDSMNVTELNNQTWIGFDDFRDILGYNFNDQSSSLTLGGLRSDVKCEVYVFRDINDNGPARIISPSNESHEGWYYENDIWKLGNYNYYNTSTPLGNTISSMLLHCWSIL